MSQNLHTASHQWAERPADERFESLESLYAATTRYKRGALELAAPLKNIHVHPTGTDGAELGFTGQSGRTALLTHHSFGQLARTAGAPADYLRALPTELAARNLNHGLSRAAGSANLLLYTNGGITLRSQSSDSYSRIWNADVVQRLLSFPSSGWRVPPARPALPDQPGTRLATAADVLRADQHGGGISIRVGDPIAPAGLYASESAGDIFVFLVNERNRITDGSPGGLCRGFFLSNSEVANNRSLRLTAFMYRSVCGNHIVWGASKVCDMRISHRGQADSRFQSQLHAEVRRMGDASAREDEQRVASARGLTLGADKDAVLDALFATLRDVPRTTLGIAYDRAEADSDTDRTIDPRTAWGMAQGLTAHSQTLPYTEDREHLDRAAGRVLQLAF